MPVLSHGGGHSDKAWWTGRWRIRTRFPAENKNGPPVTRPPRSRQSPSHPQIDGGRPLTPAGSPLSGSGKRPNGQDQQDQRRGVNLDGKLDHGRTSPRRLARCDSTSSIAPNTPSPVSNGDGVLGFSFATNRQKPPQPGRNPPAHRPSDAAPGPSAGGGSAPGTGGEAPGRAAFAGAATLTVGEGKAARTFQYVQTTVPVPHYHDQVCALVLREPETGRQMTLISNADRMAPGRYTPADLAEALLQRWALENYLKVAKERYGLDQILGHELVEPGDEDWPVPNPQHVRLKRRLAAVEALLEEARWATFLPW